MQAQVPDALRRSPRPWLSLVALPLGVMAAAIEDLWWAVLLLSAAAWWWAPRRRQPWAIGLTGAFWAISGAALLAAFPDRRFDVLVYWTSVAIALGGLDVASRG